jgi:hypothetical protein
MVASPCVLGAIAACSPAPAADGGAATCPTVSTDCPQPPPSWSKDVQPLVQTYCVSCHSDGGLGESLADLTSYTNVFKNRTEVLQQVYHCYMPNQDASTPPPPVLTADQRETIVAWIACNAPNN